MSHLTPIVIAGILGVIVGIPISLVPMTAVPQRTAPPARTPVVDEKKLAEFLGPQRFAQSNTGRCSGLTCGAPSMVSRSL